MQKKGLIALDLDGTLCPPNGKLSAKARLYIRERYHEGWVFAFVTGRIFPYAMQGIHAIDVPYLLATQNGADILSMPERTVVQRVYLTRDVVLDVDALYKEEKESFLIYAGFDRGDFCYYQPNRFSGPMLHHLETLMVLSAAPWVRIHRLEEIDQQAFPMLKGVGEREFLRGIQSRLLKHHSLATALGTDPVDPAYSILLINAVDATKGHALEFMRDYLAIDGPTIAAGDDYNDLPMLEKANLAIAMSTAPDALKKCASLIASPVEEDGVLQALDKAIRHYVA